MDSGSLLSIVAYLMSWSAFFAAFMQVSHLLVTIPLPRSGTPRLFQAFPHLGVGPFFFLGGRRWLQVKLIPAVS